MATLSKLLRYEYTEEEAAAILRAFRYREKLDRDDYITRTFSKITDVQPISRVVDVRTWSPDKPDAAKALEHQDMEYESPVKLYREVRAFLRKYVDLVEDLEYDVLTAKVLESWKMDKFNEIGYIFFVGPPRSGKTRAMETLAEVCYRPILAATMATAVIYRLLDRGDATLFLDEIQQYLNDDKTQFIALLNAGQRRGLKAWINVPTGDGWEPRGFEVFGSKFMASTEETANALSTRCVIIVMVKNARRIPLRIDREETARLCAKLQKYSHDTKDEEIPDLEPLFHERKFRDYRNIEAFINLVAVTPPEFRENILKYAKTRDNQIAQDEGMGFYSDLYKAIETAYQHAEKGKTSIQAIADAYNMNQSASEQLNNQKIGYQVNVMGLRDKDRMSDGKMARLVNEKIMKRLRRRYGDSQLSLDESEGSEDFEDSEGFEGGGFEGSETKNTVEEPAEGSKPIPSKPSDSSEPSESSDFIINLTREQQAAIVSDTAEYLSKMPHRQADHDHYLSYLVEKHPGVLRVAFTALLWNHPDFTRVSARRLMYTPREVVA